MSRFSLRDALSALALASLFAAVAMAQTSSSIPGLEVDKPSTASKITSSVKSGFGKISQALKPSTKKAPDPISLSVPADPSPDFHVAVARMAEQKGNMAKAEHHYREALKLDSKHMDALMGYAHMLDRQHKLGQATKLYQVVVQAHPNSASAHNDLGICYARQGKLEKAVPSLERAIQIEPGQARYRNNLATILVQSQQLDEAFVHLSAVHPKAVAFYNLGFLLQKAGDPKGAIRLFQEALSIDPSLAQARVWLERLQSAGAIAEPTRQPQAIARRPAMPPASAATPNRSTPPLPPANTRPPATQYGSPTPMNESSWNAAPQLAPLPSVKPLPPINGSY